MRWVKGCVDESEMPVAGKRGNAKEGTPFVVKAVKN